MTGVSPNDSYETCDIPVPPCGCHEADTDSDGDRTADCFDGCPHDAQKVDSGVCGCGQSDVDSDGDLVPDCDDSCPQDPEKTRGGVCGCHNPDLDSDGDGTMDCIVNSPLPPTKTLAGICDCGTADTDLDNDGTPDCNDACPLDATKTSPGQFGCGNDVCECPCGGSTETDFVLKSQHDESMCLNWVSDAGNVQGAVHMANVEMIACDGSDKQMWTFEDGEHIKLVQAEGEVDI